MRYSTISVRPILPWLAGVGFTLLVSACSESDPTDAGTNILVDPDAQFRGLQIIGDKELFAQAIRAALLNQHNAGGGVVDGPLNGAPVPEPAVDSDQSLAESSSTDDVTGTNVQEIGVDEADQVKSDGEFLYVLTAERQHSGPEIDLVADSSPAQPSNSQIRILSIDADAADASLVSTLDIDGGNSFADGLYLYTGDNFKSLILTSSTFGGYWDQWHNPVQFHKQQSTIRKFDVADPSAVSVDETLTLDGQVVSSRRVGQYLYVATRYYPEVPGVNPWETEAGAAAALINEADIETLLPAVTRESDQTSEPLADADRCFVAQKPERGYYSPDIITLAVVDLTSMRVTDSVCYLGATETLYASTNSAYLATTEYTVGDDVVTTDPDDAVSSGPAVEPRITTDIHQFNFSGSNLFYVGTGAIEGHLGWNPNQKPFRMSEKDGYLRVASYNGFQNGDQSPVLVSVLKPAGERVLELIARLPNDANPGHIGKPGEQLHASRFLGDKAYLVTFRQTDPLYVIDLENPRQPIVTGELIIDGYSDYLHPVGEDYLLGIGKGAIAAPDQPDAFRGAFAQGVKISLFDVSNPQAPREVQSLEIGKRGTDAEALYDHHGITVQRATEERPTRVAFGINVHDRPTPYSTGPAGWYDWRESGLYGFEIQTGANAGIAEHGKMIVESWSDQQPWGPQRYGDRSVIVNDSVFYIHGEQVFGADWNAMQNINGPR